jgi:extradiol dioxygenase family protein
MPPPFHLSLGVESLTDAVDFFTTVLPGVISHRDPSGYVNVDLSGARITFKETRETVAAPPEFHFGINVGMEEFGKIEERVRERRPECVLSRPRTVDGGTPMERRKMYLSAPGGYVVEIKGYPA